MGYQGRPLLCLDIECAAEEARLSAGVCARTGTRERDTLVHARAALAETGLLQDAARLGVADEAIRILLQEEPLVHEFSRRLFNRVHIALVILVALLQR
jgi:hypothetical protein